MLDLNIGENEISNVLNQEIDILKLNPTVRSILKRNGIFTIKNLLDYGLAKLVEIPELQIKLYVYLKRKLEAFAMENKVITNMYLNMSLNRPFSKIPIQEFDIPEKVIDVLLKAGINTAEELLKYDDAILTQMPGLTTKNIRRILAVKEEVLGVIIVPNNEREPIVLESSIDILNLPREVLDIFIINHAINIREVINIGMYGLVQMGVDKDLAEEIWRQIEDLALISPEIKEALDVRNIRIKEMQEKYKNTPIRDLKKLVLGPGVQYCLENVVGVQTVEQIVQISEADVRNLKYNEIIINRTIGAIRKIKGHYENGSLEEVLDIVLEENVSLDSNVSVLNLTAEAKDALESINCITVRQLAEIGGIDGLIIKGITEHLAKQIWGQIEKLIPISHEIEFAINSRREEIKEKQKEYQNISLTEIRDISPTHFQYLKDVFKIETIGQLVTVTEDRVYSLVNKDITAKRILNFIQKIKLYYNSGQLEDILNRVTDKDVTLNSSISVLKLTQTTERYLSELCILSIKQVIEAGKYGLKRKRIKKSAIEEIWRQIEKIAEISPTIKEVIDEQEKKKETAKIGYNILPIDRLNILPIKYLIFLGQKGVKTVRDLMLLTEEQLVDEDKATVNKLFKYIRVIKEFYSNADLERIITHPDVKLDPGWVYEILEGENIEQFISPFEFKYKRRRMNREYLYRADNELVIKIIEANRLFREIASRETEL